MTYSVAENRAKDICHKERSCSNAHTYDHYDTIATYWLPPSSYAVQRSVRKRNCALTTFNFPISLFFFISAAGKQTFLFSFLSRYLLLVSHELNGVMVGPLSLKSKSAIGIENKPTITTNKKKSNSLISIMERAMMVVHDTVTAVMCDSETTTSVIYYSLLSSNVIIFVSNTIHS